MILLLTDDRQRGAAHEAKPKAIIGYYGDSSIADWPRALCGAIGNRVLADEWEGTPRIVTCAVCIKLTLDETTGRNR